MTKLKGLLISSLAVAFAAVLFVGCGGVNEEEMAQLESLRKEVNTLNGDINGLRSEKTKLEREIAEKNAKLEQCAKDKEETQKNLEKLPK
ncbi:MAG: hypothetical protein NTX22_02855 [Ignavibacteriales bacterium]|nr:hypothetical protein [Ignavibacteriales bacterium]